MTTPTENSAPASADQKWGLLCVLALLILILFFLVALCPLAPNTGFAGSAAVLSMIAAVALGIERIIEAFWTIIGLTKGAFWPLNLINDQVNGMVEDLDDKLRPVYDEAEKAIRTAAVATEEGQKKLEEALKELEKLKANTARLKELAPDNQRVNLIAASAFQGVSLLEKKYPAVAQTAEVAQQAIVGVSDFVATFKDNPGRRLISILLGMILGLLVAGVIRLDVFEAAAQTPPTAGQNPPAGAQQAAGQNAPAGGQPAAAPANAAAGAVRERETNFLGFTVGLYWGVAFTGLLMGLGSNPTHEVIRAIQEFKKSRKSDNDPAPVITPPGASRADVARQGGGDGAAGPRGVSTFSLRRRS